MMRDEMRTLLSNCHGEVHLHHPHPAPAKDQYRNPPGLNQTKPSTPRITVRGPQHSVLGQQLRQSLTLSWARLSVGCAHA